MNKMLDKVLILEEELNDGEEIVEIQPRLREID